jgi:hypothetical protein
MESLAWRHIFRAEGSGGARNAEDVIAQITINAMKRLFAPAALATKGNAAKAAQDSAVSTATIIPRRLTSVAMRSAAMPIAVSVMVKMAWSIMSKRITAVSAMPTCAASFGR